MSAYQGLENAVRTLRELRTKKLQEVAEIDSAIDDILAEMECLPREPDADASPGQTQGDALQR